MRYYGTMRHPSVVRALTLSLGIVTLIALATPHAERQAAAGAPATPAAGGQMPAPATSQSVQPQAPPAADAASTTEWAQWTSGRYRITPGDVIDLRFPFVAELDQTLAVQPDGYITLREIGDMRVQGRTVPQLRADLLEAYGSIVRNPVFTVVLKEFEKPYFVIAGEITKPGRYDLRGATTLTQALAYAGGPTSKAKVSEVVIFRNYTEDSVTVRQIDVKAMYDKKDLSEDPMLRPGDTIFLSKSTLGKLSPVLSKIGIGLYLDPFGFR